MNVACGACPAKYVIPDEKVKGRKVRIPCKHCGAAIIVDGTASAGVVEAPSKAPSPAVSAPTAQATAPANPSARPAAPRAAERAPVPPANPVAQEAAPKAAEIPGRPAVEIPKPAPDNPKPAVRPAPRNIRQTIIGVAAPANAPEFLAQPVRRPTPIYVRAAGADGLNAPGAGAQPPQPAANPSGQMRSIRRTMLGGLDADAPTSESTDASTPLHPQKRNVKQTIIGGLEAPMGSAPGANHAAPKRPRPPQDTPPGTWLAALPDGKTLKIAERDLPRAVKKAYISMETPLWHTGMSDWVPLDQIPELLSLLNKSATLPQAVGQEPTPAKEIGAAKNDARNVIPKGASPSLRVPANEPKRPPLPFAAPPLAQPKAPARASSTSTSRQPAIPRVSGAPAAPAQVPSLHPSRAESPRFSAAKPQLSRGPASVSARSSSPTLELVEIKNDEEIAGIVAAEAEAAEPAALQDLERLAAAKPASMEPKALSKAPSNQPHAPMPFQEIGEPETAARPSPVQEPFAFGSAGVVQGSSSSVSVSSSIPTSGARNTMPASRRRKSRAPIVFLVVLLIVAALIASFATRQPAALYGFLRAHGWEQPLDRVVQPLTLKVKKLIHL